MRFAPSSTVNHTVLQKGKEFEALLVQRAQVILTNLINLLPSNYLSTVQGPNYTTMLKGLAVELARVELSLEGVFSDLSFQTCRSDYLHQVCGCLAFFARQPHTDVFTDNDYKQFLIAVLKIYFKGSLPSSVAEAAKLFFSNVTVTENYLLVQGKQSGYDISDQFGFQLTFDSLSRFPADFLAVDYNLRLLLSIIKPAHTLYQIRHIFKDSFPSEGPGAKQDTARWELSNYHYDDVRKFWPGLDSQDLLGAKRSVIIRESHTGEF